MLKKIKMLVVALVLGISCAGCANTSVFVLDEKEIVPLSKGEVFTAPYDGCFYSLQAEKRVMDAKRIDTKLK